MHAECLESTCVLALVSNSALCVVFCNLVDRNRIVLKLFMFASFCFGRSRAGVLAVPRVDHLKDNILTYLCSVSYPAYTYRIYIESVLFRSGRKWSSCLLAFVKLFIILGT